MDSNSTPARRRRGAELESALLDAAWEELDANGYVGLTMEAVAARAGTSRPVISRRWPSRSDLAVAAIRHHFDDDPIDVPDHGSLREDTLDLLRQFTERRSGLVVLIMLRYSGILGEAEGGIAGLRERLLSPGPSMLDTILDRADARGEIDRSRMPDLVAGLPTMALRHEMVMTLRPADEATLVAIVDDLFLPLATATRTTPGAEPR
ncbi:TetR/AcrR family transcriptional regulator [Leifsonia naganoensis]|uniref:AcrR family transcriptional regulator n=1 Tax=Leifsonia naganoensis TaxID=150025 RepID=A0A853DVB6_9MICO|nr:TetR/AcrR family transcriptional regulator [Leifsonia naganoensis]NYK11509.1 AcrR family transcriptional regulator [Leifsonia naganoensis]